MIKKLDLALKNVRVWELRADIWTLSGLMHELPMDSSWRAEILFALQRAIDVTDPDDVAGTAVAARAGADGGTLPASVGQRTPDRRRWACAHR